MNKYSLPSYTIQLKLNMSPSLWDLNAMSKNLVPIRDAAYDVEAKNVEKLVDRSDLKDAKKVIEKIKGFKK